MSTLVRKTPIGENLEGFWIKENKVENTTNDKVQFFYRFPEGEEIDQILENQPIKGLQMDKNSVMIYTSEPFKFSGSDRMDLETEPRVKKVKQIFYDHRNPRKTGMRLKNVRDKHLYLGKLITLE